MKKNLLGIGFITLFSLINFSVFAQTLYGLTSEGGNDFGTIFKVDKNGENHEVLNANFNINGNQPGNCQLVEFNSRLYGTTTGIGGYGTFFEYDPATNRFFHRKLFYDATNDGFYPNGSVCVFNNKLYGVTEHGGANNVGSIFEYDPVTLETTKKADFDGVNGSNPNGFLTVLGSKLYGLGGNNIFEYDPLTNTLVEEFYLGLSGVSTLKGGLIAVGSSLIGVSKDGGVNNNGAIFEYIPSTNTFTKKIDFSWAIGAAPTGKLVASGTKLYGLTSEGGVNGYGVLFEYDPSTSIYTKKVDFDASISGGTGTEGCLHLYNGKLYGMTRNGGSNSYGNLFEYTPGGTSVAVKGSFDGTVLGKYPIGTLATFGTKLYGMTNYGGETNESGVLFEYDPTNSVLSKKFNFNSSELGINGNGSLIYNNQKLYGLSYLGGEFGSGCIFEFNPATNIAVIKASFNPSTTGGNPQRSLIEYNNKLYGVTNAGGSNGYGCLFEFNPSTSALTKKYDFTSSCISPIGDLVVVNSKFYGIASIGSASNNEGALFEFDPVTNTLTNKYDFHYYNNPGSYPKNPLTVYNNNLYGMTSDYGLYSEGVLFEYNPTLGYPVPKIDLKVGITGLESYSKMVVYNNKMYGMTKEGGTMSSGTLFEYDPVANTFNTKIDFGDDIDGINPVGSLAVSENKLIGTTSEGGASGYGIVFIYDPSINSIAKTLDFTGINGKTPKYMQLTSVDGTTTDVLSKFANISTSKIEVGPNPANDYIWVESSEKGDITLMTIMGEIIWEKSISEKTSISITSLIPGIYILNFKNENGIAMPYKVIKR